MVKVLKWTGEILPAGNKFIKDLKKIIIMAVILGTVTPSDFYVGAGEISEIYLGDKLVYQD